MTEKYIITTGTFNLITPAHVFFLEKAKRLGDKLIVMLDGNERNEELKKDKVFLSYNERRKILTSIKWVDEVHCFNSIESLKNQIVKVTCEHFEKEIIFAKGREYEISSLDPEVLKVLDENNITIAFIPLLKDNNGDKISTTNLIERIRNV